MKSQLFIPRLFNEKTTCYQYNSTLVTSCLSVVSNVDNDISVLETWMTPSLSQKPTLLGKIMWSKDSGMGIQMNGRRVFQVTPTSTLVDRDLQVNNAIYLSNNRSWRLVVDPVTDDLCIQHQTSQNNYDSKLIVKVDV